MTPDTAAPLLSVENLGVRLATSRGMLRALDGVGFQLAMGRSLGVVGESGCGKTMLCRALIGLLPPAGRLTAASRLCFDGSALEQLGPREMSRLRGRDIAMVFQNPLNSLNPVIRIGKQIGEVLLRHRTTPRRTVRRAVLGLLASVGIADPERCADSYPHHLSGGMRQRAVLAVALACRPRLLLADEPTTALDVTIQAEILGLIDEQRRKHRTAVILVSHDLGIVATHTDQVAVMYAGRLVEHAPVTELFARPRHPYSRALLAAVPRLDTPSHEPLQAIPGHPPDLCTPLRGCAFAPRCPDALPRCGSEPPALESNSDGHRVACWHPCAGRGGA